eukprot:TRINITY_DN4111_c0_g1_i1.p1 TRINITY_DN4111_c0_g1~~TRINITY_DN4111_c0_g1_i1.p1  ORF type:complete len:149 (-),score=11.62 TRINITY_DN4111_c0_g1_i1:180-626(-)
MSSRKRNVTHAFPQRKSGLQAHRQPPGKRTVKPHSGDHPPPTSHDVRLTEHEQQFKTDEPAGGTENAGADLRAWAKTGSRVDAKDTLSDDAETFLRQFDLNMAYGPCLGMTRMERWQRAKTLGLNPPEYVRDLLRVGQSDDCLWEGRV